MKENRIKDITRIKSRTPLEIIGIIINLKFQRASMTDPLWIRGSKTHDVLLPLDI